MRGRPLKEDKNASPDDSVRAVSQKEPLLLTYSQNSSEELEAGQHSAAFGIAKSIL